MSDNLNYTPNSENDIEVWRDIPGFQGYQVSSHGRVKSFRVNKVKGIMMNPTLTKRGYRIVNFRKNNAYKGMLVHRLVGIVFIPNPKDKPNINHIDNNPENNRVSNLEWCTQKENIQHAIKIGAMQCHGANANGSKLTENQAIFAAEALIAGRSNRDIADELGVSPSIISDLKNGYSWGTVLKDYDLKSLPPGRKGRFEESDIIEILDMYNDGMSQVDICNTLGIHPSTLSPIIRGVTWKHLPRPWLES